MIGINSCGKRGTESGNGPSALFNVLFPTPVPDSCCGRKMAAKVRNFLELQSNVAGGLLIIERFFRNHEVS